MSTEKEQIINSMKGLSFLRDGLLPLLLDEDEDAILYWAGKELAHQYPQENGYDVKTFFATYQLGSLGRGKEKKSQTILTLQGPAVEARFEESNPSFSLEAGLLAGFYQKIHQIYAEATVEVQTNQKKVEIIIHYDKKEIIDV